MLFVTYLAILKLFYILINFDSFSTYFLLTIVNKNFTHLLNIYAPKYETTGKF
jgi:hypothetical protein